MWHAALKVDVQSNESDDVTITDDDVGFVSSEEEEEGGEGGEGGKTSPKHGQKIEGMSPVRFDDLDDEATVSDTDLDDGIAMSEGEGDATDPIHGRGMGGLSPVRSNRGGDEGTVSETDGVILSKEGCDATDPKDGRWMGSFPVRSPRRDEDSDDATVSDMDLGTTLSDDGDAGHSTKEGLDQVSHSASKRTALGPNPNPLEAEAVMAMDVGIEQEIEMVEAADGRGTKQ